MQNLDPIEKCYKSREVDPPFKKKKCGRWPKKPAKKSRIWSPSHLENFVRWTPPHFKQKTREVAEKKAKTTEFGPP